MSNALKCDRCGKFFEGGPDKDGHIEIKRFENRGNDKYPPIGWACKDLCPECQKQIQMWYDGEVMFIRKMKPKTYAKLIGRKNSETVTPEGIVKEAEHELLYSGRRINDIVNEVMDKALKWAWTTSVDEMDRVMRERGLEAGDDDDGDEEWF